MAERWFEFSNLPLFDQIRNRVNKTLLEGIKLNMSTEESKKFLRRHANNRTTLISMFVDINNSTEMSLSLPEKQFTLLVQCFTQEVSISVLGYGGYVFKYEGDAIILLFPVAPDILKACKNALNCSTAILEIIKEIINPVFKTQGLPEITVRIGLTCRNALVVVYGGNLDKVHIDIIGSSISLASKIVSIARPNQVSVGESIYNIIMSPSQVFMNIGIFKEIDLDPTKWKYLSDSDPDSMYRVYEYIPCQLKSN